MVHVSRYDLNVSLSLCSDITTPSHFYSSRSEHTGNVDEIIPLTFQDKIRSMCSKIIKKSIRVCIKHIIYCFYLTHRLQSLVENRVALIVYSTPVRCAIFEPDPFRQNSVEYIAFEYWGVTIIFAVLTENRPFGLMITRCVTFTPLLSKIFLILSCVESFFISDKKYPSDFLYVTTRKMFLFSLFPVGQDF